MAHYDYWMLDDSGEPVPTDVMTWARWFNNDTLRRLGLSRVGPYRVSTMFLGLTPVLWETMVFVEMVGAPPCDDLDGQRYATRQDAIEGHLTTCQLVALEVERQDGVAPAIVHDVALVKDQGQP